jgi:type III secretion protein Q
VNLSANTPHTATAGNGPDLPARALAGLLARLSPAQAGLSRLLLDQRLHTLLRADGSVSVVATSAAPAGDCYELHAHSDLGPIDTLLCVPGLASLAWAAAKDTPAALRPVLASAALEPVVQLAHQLGIAGFELRGISGPVAGALQSPAPPWWQLREQGQVLAWFSPLQWPTAAWPALRGKALGMVHTLPQGLQLAARVQLWQRRLPLATLRSLQSGDVLLTPWPSAALTANAAAPAVTLRWGTPGGHGAHARASLAHHLLTLEGPLHMSPDDIDPAQGDQDSITQEAPAEPDTLAAMELPLRFELDTVSIPLADLQAIRPGYVIELPTPLHEATLRLVACGQTVGHAELVAVGDRLGARVTRMVLNDEPTNRH